MRDSRVVICQKVSLFDIDQMPVLPDCNQLSAHQPHVMFLRKISIVRGARVSSRRSGGRRLWPWRGCYQSP